MQTPITSLSVPPAAGGLAADPSTVSGGSTSARLKDACKQFEGQFMALMLQEMRKTIPKDTLLGDDGHTQQIFTQMMDDQVAQEMAKQSGGNDLASELYRQLSGAFAQSANAPAAAPAPAEQAKAAAPEETGKSR